MHFFLTGEIGIGKSTVVDRVLEQISTPVGGFRTGFGPDRGAARRSLYLWPAWEKACYDEAHAVACFHETGVIPLPRRFSALGTAALSRADAALVIMDECGRLEEEALPFQRAILERLNRPIPVLGVVREGFPGWTKAIAHHPEVKLLTVTEENRDDLPGVILNYMMR